MTDVPTMNPMNSPCTEAISPFFSSQRSSKVKVRRAWVAAISDTSRLVATPLGTDTITVLWYSKIISWDLVLFSKIVLRKPNSCMLKILFQAEKWNDSHRLHKSTGCSFAEWLLSLLHCFWPESLRCRESTARLRLSRRSCCASCPAGWSTCDTPPSGSWSGTWTLDRCDQAPPWAGKHNTVTETHDHIGRQTKNSYWNLWPNLCTSNSKYNTCNILPFMVVPSL